VNDPEDRTGSSDYGTVWVYSYDRGGNILSKKCYARQSDGSQGSLVKEYVYTYAYTFQDGETVRSWKDVLTGYDGKTIQYDGMGNPVKYGTYENGVWTDTWEYTWQHGRQLRQMTHTNGTQITYDYNAEGLRIRKTVSKPDPDTGATVTTVTEYTLHGANIVHMVQGNASMHFWYDAGNRPAMVEYNGTKYTYIHNLQGDVLGLLDAGGIEVVRYAYDAWGKVLSTTGSMAGTLGTVQPFSYRGYVYDKETGLHYLRSRYYNSEHERFLNSDVFLCHNLYTYCNNIPTICKDNEGALTEVIINGKTYIGEYYGLSEKLAEAIDIILADAKNYAYSKYLGKDANGKKRYKYGIYR